MYQPWYVYLPKILPGRFFVGFELFLNILAYFNQDINKDYMLYLMSQVIYCKPFDQSPEIFSDCINFDSLIFLTLPFWKSYLSNLFLKSNYLTLIFVPNTIMSMFYEWLLKCKSLYFTVDCMLGVFFTFIFLSALN